MFLGEDSWLDKELKSFVLLVMGLNVSAIATGLLVLVYNDKVVFDLFNIINDEDTVKVYVFHGVSEANQAPFELEFVPNVSDSEVASYFYFSFQPYNWFSYYCASTISFYCASTIPFFYCASTIPLFYCASTLSCIITPPPCIPSYDPIIDNDPSDDEVEDKLESEGDTNEDTDVDSNVHQKYIDIRESKRHFKRSQRRSRGTTSDQINVDEKGPDIGSTPSPKASSQATTNNESGRGSGTGRVSSSIGVPTQSHGTATNTEVIQTRCAGTATTNSQSQTSSSRKTQVPRK
ncbi:hypothetical protein R3W88_004220 [Solanum pinnatisectum]|uniref:Transmembrane protein n=1 Tax=Solanum pinnatisectum TaxID=50273 RepID=A0AAV9KCB1_9SOLN|nr:hypothetical protein R3W88_004220 [Solanum pinnatisectum]